MTIFKCKMCGGTLEITEGSSVCTCEFCDTVQTLPTIQDEGLQNLFNRANVLRMKSEFDKAAEIYEKILQKSSEEAEAYWGLILCKYGIEYVEDPDTYKRIPTCHRASYDSVVADDDYKMALQYADMSQKAIYEEEAKVIDEVQKGIITLAQKADPYDVFICYKETDENGQRTQDSVIANDIYYQLTQEGFKVFYAAITLEDKLGSEYEPYIFSALNTAKVLLSIGTKPEYFNAVWVKNEWSRFLKIMKKDRSKMLIPCYKDMDAYELPEEFAHLQAQNMSKIGFINDLVRGIKKVIVKEEPKKTSTETTVVQTAYSSNIQALLDRGHMALEDSEWDKADGFFEDVLNQDAKCADAYVGKLLAANKVGSLDNYFSKLESKYSSATSEKLYACNEDKGHIHSIVKENVLEGFLEADDIKRLYVFNRSYMSALSCRKEQRKNQQAEIESDKLLARVRQHATGELKDQIESGLANIISILDARVIEEQQADDAQITEITAKYQAHIEEKDRKVRDKRAKADQEKYKYYESLVADMNKASSLSSYEIARDKFKALRDYEDSVELAKKCQSEIDKINLEELNEKDRQKRKTEKIAIISVSVIVAVIAVIVLILKVVIPTVRYNNAINLKNNGRYTEAITAFENLDGYKDSNGQILECNYNLAVSYMNEGQYTEAIAVFEYLDGYKDSNEQIRSIKSSVEYISTLSVGESFYYGNYNDELLEWTILDIQNNQVFAITTNAVDKIPYNNTQTDVTWKKCSLRTWLNDDFYNDAFSSEEQSRIMTTTVSPGNNPHFSTNAGSSTEDKVFLLSIDEVNQYFSTNESRICKYNGTACWWWLRSPGYFQDFAVCVNGAGSVYYSGLLVDLDDYAVRPAMWINLET